MYDVEHAVGQAGLGPQLGDHGRRGGIALAGLEDERVAARDRNRVHPHRHHDREVERSDPGDHSEWLAERVDVDTGRHLVGVLAFQQRGDAAGVLDDLEPALNFAHGVGHDLAMFVGNDLRDLARAPVNQFAEIEEDLRPLGQRRLRPRLEGGTGDQNGLVHVSLTGQHDLRLLLPRRRVPDRATATRRPGTRLAADPVLDRPHGRPPDLLVALRLDSAALRLGS